MSKIYGLEGIKQLSGTSLDLATVDALGWKLMETPATPGQEDSSDQQYYLAGDGNIIIANTWQPTKRARQMLKLMLDYRIGVTYHRQKKRWKAVGYLDQTETGTDSIFTYGISPAEAVC